MKRRNLRFVPGLIFLAVLILVICVASRNSEQDAAADWYAAGQAALATGPREQAIVYFREL
jgi:outer membrane protein assembly factor BamD (BamD/ComL family)